MLGLDARPHSATSWYLLAGAFGGAVSLAAPGQVLDLGWRAARDSRAQLILTTWPPFLHSCGLSPPAGAMLQFDT